MVCGNTFVMKPSERVPLTTTRLVELLADAGAPPGVVNVIHGQHDAVNFICDHPSIRAISFVGSDQAVSNNNLSSVTSIQFNNGLSSASTKFSTIFPSNYAHLQTFSQVLYLLSILTVNMNIIW